jgi:hypothetical protein
MTLCVTENQGKLAEQGQSPAVMGDAPSQRDRVVQASGGVKKC